MARLSDTGYESRGMIVVSMIVCLGIGLAGGAIFASLMAFPAIRECQLKMQLVPFKTDLERQP